MRNFEQEWEDFKLNVIPEDASTIQINEMKKAFYSGALALVALQCKAFSDGQEVTDQDVDNYDQLVNEIVSECKSFSQERKREYERN